jgi:hypothetical protein
VFLFRARAGLRLQKLTRAALARFLIIGAVCSAWGICLLLFLPSSPATTWWLTRDERLMAVARLRGNQVRRSSAFGLACVL